MFESADPPSATTAWAGAGVGTPNRGRRGVQGLRSDRRRPERRRGSQCCADGTDLGVMADEEFAGTTRRVPPPSIAPVGARLTEPPTVGSASAGASSPARSYASIAEVCSVGGVHGSRKMAVGARRRSIRAAVAADTMTLVMTAAAKNAVGPTGTTSLGVRMNNG